MFGGWRFRWRLGAKARGRFQHPTEPRTPVEHALGLCASLGAETVLVGSRPDYAHLGVPMLHDARTGIGPMGGPMALTDYGWNGRVLALACDMPFVPDCLLRHMIATIATVVVPSRRTGLEPLCAVYDSMRTRVAIEQSVKDGRHGLRALLRRLPVTELVLSEQQERWLDDWDEPSDMEGAQAASSWDVGLLPLTVNEGSSWV